LLCFEVEYEIPFCPEFYSHSMSAGVDGVRSRVLWHTHAYAMR